MARMASVVVPHITHHVTQRGNRRMKTFFHDADYEEYIDLGILGAVYLIDCSCNGSYHQFHWNLKIMARMARVVVPHITHHVTQRGNRRMKTFFHDADYEEYIDLMAQACKRGNTEVWAYCLMPNHVHFVLVPHVSGAVPFISDG